MSTVYDLLTKIDGKNVNIFKYGYEEAPEAALLLYNLWDLNSESFDFRGQTIKQIATKMHLLPGADYIEWNDEDLKEANDTIQVVNSTTNFDMTATNYKIGETLRNATTNVIYTVTGVAGTTITISAADALAAAGDTIVRVSYGKRSGLEEGFTAVRNQLQNKQNYVKLTEVDVTSNLFDNNQLRLFAETPETYIKMQFADASRKIVKGIAMDFYIGQNNKIASGGSFIRNCGGLESFIPSAYLNVNIKGIDDTESKENLKNQLRIVQQSGLTGLFDKNKVLTFCTSQWAFVIDRFYESKVIYNDILGKVKIQIKSYEVGGFSMNLVVSNVLNALYPLGEAVAYTVPVDFAYLFMMPYDASRGTDARTLERMQGMGKVIKKAVTKPELQEYMFYTNYSFCFGGVTSGAYQKLIYA
jgi:hypothetical protein